MASKAQLVGSIPAAITMTYKDRYLQAHKLWKLRDFAQIVQDGFYCPPKIPKVATANGLTNFIVNFTDWMGYHANRISSTGRFIKSENKFDGGVFIPGTTKKGTADVMCVINGHAIMIEVKVGRDRPSEAQLNQQRKVRLAGGVYEFVSTPEDYLAIFDKYATQLQ